MGCFESKTNPHHEPTAVRGCTDIFWLILYIIFWLFMIVVAIFSFVYGNPLRLINGYDSFGNTCGVKNNEKFSSLQLSGLNTIDRPNLFFLDVKELRQTLKICVKECPTKLINNKNELYNYYQDTSTSLCRYDFNMSLLQGPDRKDLKLFDFLGPCPPFPVYESTPVLHRCIPTGQNAPGEQIRDMYDLVNSWSAAQQLLSDLYITWPLIILMSVGALLLSIVIIALMHWLTHLISWLICIFVVVASIAITVILWMTYYNIKHDLDVNEAHSLLQEFVRNETAVYVLAIIATVIMVFLIIVIFLLRSKLSALAALFEEASKCMLTLPGLAGPPILAFIALGVFLTFWITVVICLATANYPGMQPLMPFAQLQPIPNKTAELEGNAKNNTGVDYKSFQLVEYVEVNWLRSMLWLYFIGLIWVSEFIFACQQLAIAGAVAFWYFRKPTDSPILHSIAKLVKYHLGSVAKGSLLITIFKVPRLILTYLYAKMKTGADRGSECASCGLKTCICCFWFLEKFIRYLNHNAYTVIAIESVNFCPAAGIAWNAMWANALQVATINGIGDFILFLGKLAVAAVCGLISILLLRNREDVNFYVIPCVFIAIFAFFIAHIVLSLYEVVVDTLFLCVCEDRTINGPNGRWKESNLAKLLGEEPAPVEERVVQTLELTPINKQPFSSVHA